MAIMRRARFPRLDLVKGSLQEAIIRKYRFYTCRLNIANCYVY